MTNDLGDRLLDAILSHVPFDGWSETSFAAAARDVGVSVEIARGVYSRGALDMAVAFHKRGDAAMRADMGKADLDSMRYSERVAAGVRFRLQAIDDKEVVRRGLTLFALPPNIALGTRLVWGTADQIWTTLGDSSDDINWYSKRAILSGVYGSTLLFWLGDCSDDHSATWAFLDRRIEDVMRFEKTKARVRDNPVLSRFSALPNAIFGRIKAPARAVRDDLPGR